MKMKNENVFEIDLSAKRLLVGALKRGFFTVEEIEPLRAIFSGQMKDVKVRLVASREAFELAELLEEAKELLTANGIEFDKNRFRSELERDLLK